ncbi:hypothetical protein C0Q70_19270 [Pomacea canaliculata]|uniref:Uncharacterized protein n=1 Tax=Pomacea canaliculata TaxID=400727 RepID=A0A2T7NIW3_POMCA|nr:hypothetical protein C0Q70_19270 [Pomacea canaliculata]
MKCEMAVRAPPGQQLIVTFESLDIAPGYSGCADFLSLIDGDLQEQTPVPVDVEVERVVAVEGYLRHREGQLVGCSHRDFIALVLKEDTGVTRSTGSWGGSAVGRPEDRAINVRVKDVAVFSRVRKRSVEPPESNFRLISRDDLESFQTSTALEAKQKEERDEGAEADVYPAPRHVGERRILGADEAAERWALAAAAVVVVHETALRVAVQQMCGQQHFAHDHGSHHTLDQSHPAANVDFVRPQNRPCSVEHLLQPPEERVRPQRHQIGDG